MNWIRTLVHRPALVTVIYLIIFIFGLFSYSRLPIDMLPDIQAPVISIVTPYPGASALDVEDKITEPNEDALGSISGLKEISSTSRDNISLVTLLFESSVNINEAANDIRQNLEPLKNSFPGDADTPMVTKFDFTQMPILIFSVTAEGQDIRMLRDQLETELIEPLQRTPGVGSVFIRNAPERVVRVDVDRELLRAHNLTMSEVARLIAANNLNIPAGDITMGALNVSLRLPGEAINLDELRQLPLLRSPIGEGVVTLQDIASVDLQLEDSQEVAFVNGETAVMGYLRKTSDANTVEVTKTALSVFKQAEERLPFVTIHPLETGASFIEGTINNLQQTVMTGAGLVALIVFLFLRRAGPTLIVTLAIPTSMIVTFLVVYAFGFTLNSVTLIAMSLAVGLVVDNAVVALENISRLIDEGGDGKEAAVTGAKEVSGALVASTLTTLVIFAPMMFIAGIVGQVFAQLAIVMIVTISASLFVALSLTPTMAARLIKPRGPIAKKVKVTWWENRYVTVLKRSIARPWFTLISAAIIGAVTLILLSLLGTDFLPKDGVGQLAFTIELPVGTALSETQRIGERYVDELRNNPEVKAVSLRVGTSANGGFGEKEGLNVARVRASLSSPRDRIRSDEEIGLAVMDAIGTLPEVVNLEMSRDGTGAGALGATKPIVVQILGTDLNSLQDAALRIQAGIRAIPGTMNVNADLIQTRPELQVKLDRQQSLRLGLPLGAIGQELRMAMTGARVSRMSLDGQPRDIQVRLLSDNRQNASDWTLIPIRTQSGQLTTMGAVGALAEGESPIEIKRLDKARMISVSMELSERSLGEVAADVEQMLSELDLPAGIQTQIAGAIKDQRESFGDMGLLMSMGLALVYLVMVAQFESWTAPFVIMFAVPFAATGAFLALLVSGTNLSVTSFLGLVILIGVVVNNAIVLIDYTQLLREKGQPLIDAVINAGQRRLRPVLITTLTTSGGMLPLALTTGEGEQLWGPMGKTALGGLLVSSAVTLVLVPTMYVIVVRFQQRFIKRIGRDANADLPNQEDVAK